MHRQIAGSLTGPVTKWIVFAVTIVVTGVMAVLGGGLGDVKDNEQSSWVPASAESTKVADQLAGEINPNDIPTLVVYQRESGLTEADLAAIDEQAAEIAELDGVTDEGVLSPNAAAALAAQGAQVPTLLSEDGAGGLPLLHVQLRQGRLGEGPGAGRQRARDRRPRRRRRLRRRASAAWPPTSPSRSRAPRACCS